MTTDSPNSPKISFVNYSLPVRLKTEDDKMLLFLPPVEPNSSPDDWTEIWESLQSRLNSNEKSWAKDTPVHLIAKDRLLDGRQLQMIEESLQEFGLQLKKVFTSRRQTAVASVMAGYSVEQEALTEHLVSEQEETTSELTVEPLYYQNTVRSGVEVVHPGTIIILGDVNPGGMISSARDIIVWGKLRGIAHAGAGGYRQSRIMALKMQPTQLRIAEAIALPPETPVTYYEPEVAYLAEDGIRITPNDNFIQKFSFSEDLNFWQEKA